MDAPGENDEGSSPVTVEVAAKVNLHLGVGARRPDGYHELLTIFHAVGLFDRLVMRGAAAPSLTIDGEGAGTLPRGGANLVWRAVELVAARYGRPADVALSLTKCIPVAAGLAGGSADAAAALVGANELWGGALSANELTELAALLGSDVAFALHGGTAEGTGRGEHLGPISVAASLWWVLALSPGELSTPAVYARFDRLQPAPRLLEPTALLDALATGDLDAVGSALSNDLQPAAVELDPTLARTLAAGRRLGALGGVVSGSGPTCAFLARDDAHAAQLSSALLALGVCRLAPTVTGSAPGARLIGDRVGAR